MRYSVLGYKQDKVCEFKLHLDDLAILRWLQELSLRASSNSVCKDGKVYYWVNYKTLMEDLPILRSSKKTIYRKFTKLVEKGLLEHYYVTDGGAFSYYRLTTKVGELLYSQSEKMSEGRTKMSKGRTIESDPPRTKMSEQRLIYYNKPNSSIEKKRGTGPTWEDVHNVYNK